MDYIVRIDENTVVWWDQGVYDNFKETHKKNVIFQGTEDQCRRYIDKYNEDAGNNRKRSLDNHHTNRNISDNSQKQR